MTTTTASTFPVRRPESRTALERRFEAEAMPHARALYGAAMRFTRSPDDAADLLQDTFMKAFRAFDQFEQGTNCKAWLFRILTNAFINTYRRRVKEREILEGNQRQAAVHQLVHLPSKRHTLDPEGALADSMLGVRWRRFTRQLASCSKVCLDGRQMKYVPPVSRQSPMQRGG